METLDLLPFKPTTNESMMAIDLGTLRWLPSAADELPPYWSRARDAYLRDLAASNDVVATAVSLFTQKLINVPFSILPRNANIQAHARQAQLLEDYLLQQSGLMQGWEPEIAKFIKDYLTQDNGGFLMLMGEGRANGPIEGVVQGIYHLDAARCTRTGNPEFPFRYRHTDGKEYKVHWTRGIYMSHQPSPKAEHLGVGLCHLSSCLRFAREIERIMRYYEEKMGTRPARQILYVKKGATLEHLQGAVNAWKAKMDAEGSDLFAMTLLVAPRAASQELELGVLDLASTPDGFNRQETVTADNAIVAAAFGLDLRDFGYMTISSERSSEAAQLKGYSRGVATFIQSFTNQLTYKVTPKHLYPSFDYMDDVQDQMRSDINATRATTRATNLTSGTLSVRVAREQMKDNYELSDQQFNDLELADGRLPNGLDVIYLFYSEDSEIQGYLDLGTEKPLDITSYDALAMLDTIEEKIMEVSKVIDTARTTSKDFTARCALAALTKLRNRIQGDSLMMTDENTLSDGALLDDSEIVSKPQAENDENGAPNEQNQQTVPPDTAIAKELDDDTQITNADVQRLRRYLRKYAFLNSLFEAKPR